jgi:CPA2 family monovalent cation:H+ antiporter-2
MSEEAAESHAGLHDHVIIAGYGEAGRKLARVLDTNNIAYLIVTLSPEGAREAEGEALRVLRGNYTREHELSMAGARQARLLVVADDDLETTRRVVSAAHVINPALQIVARTRFESEIEELQEAGASGVIAEDQESVVRILTDVLESYEVDDDTIRTHQDALRSDLHRNGSFTRRAVIMQLSEAQQQTSKCSHTDQAQVVTPSAAGCEECLALGDAWVHLRICMTCGHVGCCDSSKNKHATKHFQATEHPIVKSFEPGEEWAWCYEDRKMF